MKAIMISIQPKLCELIASGKKTIEVRKTRPKIETPFRCYIYATRPKKWFRFSSCGSTSDENLWLSNGKVKMCDGLEFWADGNEYEPLCGKVIGEFVCDRIDEHTFFTNLAKFSNMGLPCGTFSSYLIFEDDYKKMCLSYEEVKKYGNGKTLYGLHISDLVIYDEPRDVGEFKRVCDGNCQSCQYAIWQTYGLAYEPYIVGCKQTTSPPKSWCYVEEKENENEND